MLGDSYWRSYALHIPRLHNTRIEWRRLPPKILTDSAKIFAGSWRIFFKHIVLLRHWLLHPYIITMIIGSSISIIGCICKMVCSCKKLYIGERNRDSIIRFTEHRNFVAKNQKNNSAILDHVLENPGHYIDSSQVLLRMSLDSSPEDLKRLCILWRLAIVTPSTKTGMQINPIWIDHVLPLFGNPWQLLTNHRIIFLILMKLVISDPLLLS
jgi:hypothetical protein